MESLQKLLDQLPALFEGLEKIDHPKDPAYEKKAGIYVLFENNEPIHVGNTRNLKQRVESHHDKKTSLAVKLLKQELEQSGKYRLDSTVKTLIKENRQVFNEQKRRIRKMEVRFVEVDKPEIESRELRYIAKLYIALKLGVSTEGLDT